MSQKAVVTVLGADKTGIIAGVCSALAAGGVNIIDIRQTVIDDIFSMTMMVTLDEQVADFNTVLASLQECAKDLGVQIQMQRLEVFKYMYEV